MMARFLQGMCYGLVFPCSHSYIVEIADVEVRGKLITMCNIFRSLGYLYVCIVGSLQISWQNVGFLCGVTAFTFPLIAIYFIPQSPRWLLLKGKSEEARKSLQFFRGDNSDIEKEFEEISQNLRQASSTGTVKSQIKHLLQPQIFRKFLALSIIQFIVFAVCCAILVYLIPIFNLAEISSFNSYTGAIIIGVFRVSGLFFLLLITELFDRRNLFIVFQFSAGICLLSLGSYFYTKFYFGRIWYIEWIPPVAIILFSIFSSFSVTIMGTLISELLPTSVRVFGSSVVQFITQLGACTFVILCPYMFKFFGEYWTFWILGTMASSTVVIAAIFIPETKGKTLEEISNIIQHDHSGNNSIQN